MHNQWYDISCATLYVEIWTVLVLILHFIFYISF